jgi:hypothetical protein
MPNPNIVEAGKATRFVPGDPRAGRGITKPSTARAVLSQLVDAETPEDREAAFARARRSPVIQALVNAVLADDVDVAAKYANTILDRVDGKATQRQEITGADGAPFWERISRAPDDGDGVE